MKKIRITATRGLEGRTFHRGAEYKVIMVPPAEDDEILQGQADVLIRADHAEEVGREKPKKAVGRPKKAAKIEPEAKPAPAVKAEEKKPAPADGP